jgi:hypothetical protein
MAKLGKVEKMERWMMPPHLPNRGREGVDIFFQYHATRCSFTTVQVFGATLFSNDIAVVSCWGFDCCGI